MIDEKALSSAMEAYSPQTQSQPDRDRLARAIAAYLQEEWRSVETAPRGVEVLLYEPAVTDKRPQLEARVVVGRYPTDYPRTASHWRPLPEPPSAMLAAAGGKAG